MPSTYTRNLGLEKPATGEQAGTWGDTVDNQFDFLDTAIDGNTFIGISNSGYTLSTNQGALSEGRNKVVIWTGTLTQNATVNITPNTAEKLYFMTNATTGGFSILIQQGSGGTYTLASGSSAILYCDGAGNTARVDAVIGDPQFTGLSLRGQSTASSAIDLEADQSSNYILFAKDLVPSIAAAIGLGLPGAALTDDLKFATLTGTVWTERMRIYNTGSIDVFCPINTLATLAAVSNKVAADYTAAAIEIRETNLVGPAQTVNTYAPRIAFYWGGRFAAQIGLPTSGVLAAMDGNGAPAEFQCAVLTAPTVNASTVVATNVNTQVLTAATKVTAPTIDGVTSLTAGAIAATTVTASTSIGAPTINATTANATNFVGNLVGSWAGYGIAAGVAPSGAQVIASNNLGQIYAGLINTVSADNGTTAITRVYASSDAFLRYYTLANFAAQVQALMPTVQNGVHVKIAGGAVGDLFTILNFGHGNQTSANGVGDPVTAGQVNITYNYVSDLRLKKNVRDLEGGLELIERMRPVAFEFNGLLGFPAGRRAASIIAQELKEVLPDSVYTVQDRLRPGDPETELLAWDPIQVLVQLILAVKQLRRMLPA